MAVITADGVVGKVLRVYNSTSLVLLINDQTSGVGAVLAKSRLQGILRGTPSGEVVLEKILSDEQVEAGEQVLTSGGDEIFPKGLPAGIVTSVSRGPDAFLNIHIHPAAALSRLEEVLVITQEEEKPPVADQNTPARAADILAQRLPSVPDKPAVAAPDAEAVGDGETLPSDLVHGNPAAAAGGTPAPAENAASSARTTPEGPAKPAVRRPTPKPGAPREPADPQNPPPQP
jgi:rod shape-determining protein MreC